MYTLLLVLVLVGVKNKHIVLVHRPQGNYDKRLCLWSVTPTSASKSSRLMLSVVTTSFSMEAPARHKGGIASRRNYSCDTTQLFAS